MLAGAQVEAQFSMCVGKISGSVVTVASRLLCNVKGTFGHSLGGMVDVVCGWALAVDCLEDGAMPSVADVPVTSGVCTLSPFGRLDSSSLVGTLTVSKETFGLVPRSRTVDVGAEAVVTGCRGYEGVLAVQ